MAGDIQKASAFAIEREMEMADLIRDIGGMGLLRLVWDSKVPEKDKSFFSLPCFKASDPKIIRKEIQKYQKFYEQMKIAMRHIRLGCGGSNTKEADDLILDLYDRLSRMIETAESQMESTDSTTLCTLHESFVKKHDKLENILKRVECAVLRKQLKYVTDGWQKALEIVEKLTKEMEASNVEKEKIREDFKQMKVSHDRLIEQQGDMLDEQKKTTKLLEELLKRGQD